MEADFAEETAFTSWEETKATIGQRPVHKFFLVDKSGKKQLAVTGEDLGDAHYHYRSSRPFAKYGPLDCRNRTEVLVWLERVISESGGVAGAHLMADDNNPDGVYFTQHSFERAHYPDGRRCSRWYLIDQHGDKHLAVMGIERDTKDGHYNYIAEEPFASIKGLHCSNQSGVFKWLESMITHHPGDADHAAQSRGASAQSGERSRPLVINLSSLRNARVSAAAQKSLEEAVVAEAGFQRAKPKERKSSGPPPQPVKQKSVGIVQQLQLKKAKKMQEDIIAEEQKLQQNYLIKLRRAAAAEVSADTAAKACTLGWLHGSVVGEDSEHLDTFMSLLAAVLDLQQEQQRDADTAAADPEQQLTQQQQQQQQLRELAAGLSDQDMLRWVRQPENRKHHLRVVLECLKELGASDLPARVLLARQVIPLVQRCLTYPNSAAHTMAEHMLDRWRWQLAGHMHVLTCPTYMEDHLGAVEQEISSGQVPLPQLPKHKQALLNSAVSKPPIPPGFQTPAPPAKANSNQQQQGPASAPAVLNGPISAMQAAATCIPGFTPMPVSTGFTYTSGTAGLQSPGFFTPLSPSGLTTGGLVGSGLVTDAAAVAGGFRGSGAKVPGLLGATTGPRGGLVFSSTLSGVGTSTGSAARPPGVLNAAGITINTGLGELAPAAPMTWGSMGLQNWGAVNGLFGGATHAQQQQVHVDPAAVGTIGSNNMDAVSLQLLAAEAVPSAGDGELQSPPLALQLQYQQQLRAQMIMLGQQQAAAAAGTGTGQYVGAMPQAQQQAGQLGSATAVDSLNPATQQQQWIMCPQGQSQMVWGTSPGQVTITTAAEPTQSAGRQDVYPQQ